MSATSPNRMSRHPLFRWALAVWFAALAGGGLFAVPAIFHAILLARLGFYKIGIEPRLLVTLSGALAGAIIGFAIGSYITRRARARDGLGSDAGLLPAPEDGEAAVPPAGEDTAERPYRVFDARAELGDEGLFHADPPQPAPAPAPAPGPAPAPRQASRTAAAPAARAPEALGDLTLGQLTERLASALAAAQAVPPPTASARPGEEPQEALRSALEMLSRSAR